MNRIFQILLSFFLLLVLADCAKIASPAGGPRDRTPPVVEKSKPLNKAVNFEGDQIEITFDEFIRTDAIGQDMVISPPLEERPEIRLKGKTLVIEWFDELHDSTTYTFSFGQTIRDLNEGNVLENYQFVFSTGNHLDSLAIIGTAVQAFDLEPHNEKVFLLLYSNLSDSAPLQEIPDYVGLADARGNFLINNVRPDTYRLFALQDLNRNFKYDVPEEYIGFVDSSFVLSSSIFDTLALPGPEDSISHVSDTALAYLQDSLLPVFTDSSMLAMDDSLLIALSDTSGLEEDDSVTLADLAPWSVFIDVFLFQEDNALQYLIDNSRKERRRLEMRFNRKVTDTLIIEPYNFEPRGDWYLFEEHVMNDTFVYWLTDSLVYKLDSLTLLATYLASDSLLNMVPYYDTLKFNYRDPVKKTTRRRRNEDEAEEEKEEQISITLTMSAQREQDLHLPVHLEAQHPISTIDTSRIRFIKRVDTIDVRVPYSIVHDRFKLRKYLMNVDWEGITTYKLELFPGAFTDIYGLTHDTIITNLRTRDPEYYSRILLNLSGVVGQKIIQLKNERGNIVRQVLANGDGTIEFDHLDPEKYSLKLIHDRNRNGQWDTGDYLEHFQPEAVEFHEGAISLRSNFDNEVNWAILIQDPAVTGEETSEPGESADVDEKPDMPETGPGDEGPD